ncbi:MULTISPECIES: hypothetical protein [unclassified Bradyrhizobium]|uniref:hypothetical protein n=1 Tax=unclassified Bradyrhizobium TaxID=2631580 RepID=UPI0029167648|nr:MULTISPECIES: hypothetical protein [unclassified Bradyrhizobium]
MAVTSGGRSAGRHGRLDIRRIDLLIEPSLQEIMVEFVFAPRDEHGGDAVAVMLVSARGSRALA